MRSFVQFVQRLQSTKALLTRQLRLHLRLLRQLQRIIYFKTEIAHRALQLGMARQYLHGSYVLGAPIDQGRFGSPDRMDAIGRGVKPDFIAPAIQHSGVLACTEMRRVMDPA
jgi:hypothetical protein